ncbi:MAG TPA: hypothetical protein VFF04_04305 [Candidatus Babeliales bacterium]|nr:hypothetical protein [Candidatus Babeliales bacterium]
MMKSGSGAMKWVGLAAWLITALAAIIIGLKPFGYDVMAHPSLASVAMPLTYVILVAGVLSLLMFFMALSGGCACCKE